MAKHRKIVLSALGIFVLCFFLTKSYETYNLKHNYIVTKGRVTKLISGGTAGGLQFTFEENTSKYLPLMGLNFPKCRSLVRKHIEELRSLEFPVVYSKNNVRNAEILIFKEQYKQYQIPISQEAKEIVNKLSVCR